jgi:hypothetical protein
VQGDAGHPCWQGGGQEKNYREKMEGQGGGEAQGVADPQKWQPPLRPRGEFVF